MTYPSWSDFHNKAWEDREFLALSPPAKVLLIFAFTHSVGASLTGISVAPLKELRKVLGTSRNIAVDYVLQELGEKPFVRFDYDSNVLYAVSRFKYAARNGALTQKQRKQIKAHLDSLPQDSPLVKQFKRRNAKALAEPTTEREAAA
jgi:hypothetical protein